MILQELFEDVQKDLSTRSKVNSMRKQIMHSIYTNPKPSYEVDFEGIGEFFVYTHKDMGISEHIAVCIGKKLGGRVSGPSGTIRTTKDSYFPEKYNTFLFLEILDDYNEKDVQTNINTTSTLKIIEHELQHYIDLTQGNKLNSDGVDPNDMSSYYNDPAEFNAYSHDVMGNLLSFIQYVNNGDIKTYEDFTEMADFFCISDDFNTMFKDLINYDSHNRKFFKHLSDDKKRRLTSRVFKIHQEYLNLKKSFENADKRNN